MRVRERYELAGELRDRYAAAGRSERSEILSSYCPATGYDRQHAIKVLRGRQRKAISGRGRPRRRRYGLAFQQALKVWLPCLTSQKRRWVRCADNRTDCPQ